MRIDQLLVQIQLASTRSQAQRLIADGVEWQQAQLPSLKLNDGFTQRGGLMSRSGGIVKAMAEGERRLRLGEG